MPLYRTLATFLSLFAHIHPPSLAHLLMDVRLDCGNHVFTVNKKARWMHAKVKSLGPRVHSCALNNVPPKKTPAVCALCRRTFDTKGFNGITIMTGYLYNAFCSIA